MTSGTASLTLPIREIAITQPMIDSYAAISGDFNPIHVDAIQAALGPFGGTIAHGCIPLEPVFQSVQDWLGIQYLPRGTRFRLRYRAPTRPGDVIRAVVEKSAGTDSCDGVQTLAFRCINQDDIMVMDGECLVPA